MNSDTRWRHFRIGWFLIICAAVSGNLDALAQPVSSEGVLSVASWPDFDDRQVVRDLRNNNFFPSVDTLNVGYRYWVRNDRPNGELIIEWTPGTRGIYRGDLTSMAKIPASFRLIALDMVADVVVGDQVVDALVLQIDSLSLEPSPAVSRIDDGDIPWDRLFESRDEQKARAHLESGFQLRSMRVIRMAFRAERISDERSEGKVGVAEPDGVPGPGGPLEPADPAEPDWGSVVYVPDIQVWLDWTLGGAPYYVPIVAPRPLDPVEPRGDRGRGGLTSGDNGRPSYRGPRRDDDLAEFVEMIPFDETRGYVKKVLGNYGAYLSLYPRASEPIDD